MDSYSKEVYARTREEYMRVARENGIITYENIFTNDMYMVDENGKTKEYKSEYANENIIFAEENLGTKKILYVDEKSKGLEYKKDEPESVVFDQAYLECSMGYPMDYDGQIIFTVEDNDIRIVGGNRVGTSNDEKAENFVPSLYYCVYTNELCDKNEIEKGFWNVDTLGKALFNDNRVLLMSTTRQCNRGGCMRFLENGVPYGQRYPLFTATSKVITGGSAVWYGMHMGHPILVFTVVESGANSMLSGISDLWNLSPLGSRRYVGNVEPIPDALSALVITTMDIEDEKKQKITQGGFRVLQGVGDISATGIMLLKKTDIKNSNKTSGGVTQLVEEEIQSIEKMNKTFTKPSRLGVKVEIDPKGEKILTWSKKTLFENDSELVVKLSNGTFSFKPMVAYDNYARITKQIEKLQRKYPNSYEILIPYN